MKLLEQSDLEALTGRRRPTAQAKALRSMGIDFRTRPDGKIIVIEDDLPLRGRPNIERQEGFSFGT